MRSPDRIDPFLERLGKVWKEVPDWRFGQLIANVLLCQDEDIFFLEEEETIKIFENYFKGR